MTERKPQSNKIKLLLAISSLVFITFIMRDINIAIAILSMVYIHECGHLWAATKKGCETGGIYFLPCLGAVSLVRDLDRVDRDTEAYIAVMGPVWGLLFSGVFVLVYFISGVELFLKVGGILCMINVFNLLPLNPLDGGRIFKSCMFSIHRNVGLAMMLLMVPLSVYLAMRWHIWILYLVGFFCYIDFKEELKKKLSKAETEETLGYSEIYNTQIRAWKPERKKMPFFMIIVYGIMTWALIILAFFPICMWLDKEKEARAEKENSVKIEKIVDK